MRDITKLSGEGINKMQADELRRLLKEVTPSVNSRIANIKKFSGGSPATRGIEHMIDHLPNTKEINSMSINSLKHVVTVERDFLRAKTSSVQGTREMYRSIVASTIDPSRHKTVSGLNKAIQRRIRSLGGIKAINSITEMVEDIREFDPTLEYQIGSPTTAKGNGFFGTIVEAYNNKDYLDVRDDPVKFAERIREEYEKMQRTKRNNSRFEF